MSVPSQTWECRVRPYVERCVSQNIRTISLILKEFLFSGGWAMHTVEETDIREGIGLRCCLGDVIESFTSHLAARVIWRTVFEITFILGGGLFGHPFCQSSVLLLILVLNLKSEVRHEIEWIPTPKQQRWPLWSLLSVSYFWGLRQIS